MNTFTFYSLLPFINWHIVESGIKHHKPTIFAKSNGQYYSSVSRSWHFNEGDCLIEVTLWAGLTVYICTIMWPETVLS
jgi:hypothetical protein